MTTATASQPERVITVQEAAKDALEAWRMHKIRMDGTTKMRVEYAMKVLAQIIT